MAQVSAARAICSHDPFDQYGASDQRSGTWGTRTYFGAKGNHEFLAFDIAGINPKTANGRTLLYMRAAMAECEALQTQERTQASMDKLRRDGVRVGGVPYGKAYSSQLDEHGRRIVVDVPEQIAAIARIRELYTSGASLKSIPGILQRENRPSPKGKDWNAQTVRCILRREGLITIKHWDRTDASRDTSVVTRRISELRAEKLSFKEIGARLTKEKLLPPIGAKWLRRPLYGHGPRPQRMTRKRRSSLRSDSIDPATACARLGRN
jgi:hypothetical protein